MHCWRSLQLLSQPQRRLCFLFLYLFVHYKWFVSHKLFYKYKWAVIGINVLLLKSITLFLLTLLLFFFLTTIIKRSTKCSINLSLISSTKTENENTTTGSNLVAVTVGRSHSAFAMYTVQLFCHTAFPLQLKISVQLFKDFCSTHLNECRIFF